MTVRERFEPTQVPHRVGGTTTNAFTVPPHGQPFAFILPHIATGISSHSEATQDLACGP